MLSISLHKLSASSSLSTAESPKKLIEYFAIPFFKKPRKRFEKRAHRFEKESRQLCWVVGRHRRLMKPGNLQTKTQVGEGKKKQNTMLPSDSRAQYRSIPECCISWAAYTTGVELECIRAMKQLFIKF